MSVRRLDQGMAATAASILDAHEGPIGDELRTRYRRLPVMVRTAGLSATLAFVVAKADDTDLGQAYRQVADGIRRHLASKRLVSEKPDTIFHELANLDPTDYARASAEATALAEWLSRLAEARYRAQRRPSQAGGGGG